MTLTKRISVRLTETDYSYLKKIEEKEEKTRSNIIRSLINEKYKALEMDGVSDAE